MVRVKICGITSERDAVAAVRAGADALGFIFAESPRRVGVETVKKIARAVGPEILTVGVFVDEGVERMLVVANACGLSAIQLHGDENVKTVETLQKRGYLVVKALRATDRSLAKKLKENPADLFLFDTAVRERFGGTGQVFDWKTLKHLKVDRPWMVSGGLNVRNVKELLRMVQPYGVDASSGVERSPGKKDHRLVKEFIKNAKSAR